MVISPEDDTGDGRDFAAARSGRQPVAEPPGHARAHQAVADHEQGRDEHDVGVAEAGQRLARGEHFPTRGGQQPRDAPGDHAREGQRREHDQRHGIHARLVDREHGDGGGKQNQNHRKFGAHGQSYG
jgi:hypothetical protein